MIPARFISYCLQISEYIIQTWDHPSTQPRQKNFGRKSTASHNKTNLQTCSRIQTVAPDQPSPAALLAHRRTCQKIPAPPYPDHPIRSVRCVSLSIVTRDGNSYTVLSRYLKKVVLPALESEQIIEKSHIKNASSEEEIQRLAEAKTKANRKAARAALNTWVWRILNPDADVAEPPKRPVSSLAADVGFNEDYLHLNKRREGARDKKLQDLLLVAKMMNKKDRERHQQRNRRGTRRAKTGKSTPHNDRRDAPHASI